MDGVNVIFAGRKKDEFDNDVKANQICPAKPLCRERLNGYRTMDCGGLVKATPFYRV
ncbi:hypothetical protein MACH26_28550 [Planctobacterium marinum]|uniref:Uncharacterized protein n=1 Tax=Planctobacterium marinum TaxID=1631968 RepID=A0AA48HST3_9ALTE|nr:hypothetical protein MACH26_28550 [Planctobacterium marinum]